MKKAIATATIGGGVLVIMKSAIQIANYKNNSGQDTMMAIVTLLVGISAVNYSINKIKYE